MVASATSRFVCGRPNGSAQRRDKSFASLIRKRKGQAPGYERGVFSRAFSWTTQTSDTDAGSP